MKHYVYLAGPIDGQTYNSATDWRELVATQLNSDKIECLSPMRGKSFLEGVGVIRGGYEYNAMSSDKGVNRRDFFDCTRASCVLVNFLPSPSKASIGTSMEVAWAFYARIPIVRVMEKGNVHDHPMINDCVTYTTETLEEAVTLIKYLLNDHKPKPSPGYPV